MTVPWKPVFVFLVCMALGIAGAFLVPRGRKVVAVSRTEALAQVARTDSLHAELLGLPSSIYVGENLSYLVHVESAATEGRTIRVVHSDPWSRQEQTVTLAPAGSADVPLTLRVASPVSAAATLTISPADDAQHPLWQRNLWFRDGRSDMSDIVTADRAYANAKGEPVILVNSYEDETQYRRWAPVEWAVREWQRRGAPVVLSALEGFRAEDKDGLPKEWKFIPYSGNPLSAALNLPSEIPSEGPVIVCLAWGFDEATRGFPARDLARGLDLTIDRLRQRNPAVQVALVTPPPSPAMPEASARYAEAIRTLAREHHTQLIDLAAKTLGERDWQRMYALDNDPNLTGLYPQGEALQQLDEWLRRGLINRESFATGEHGERPNPVIPTAFASTEVTPPASPESLNVQFPGIATITRPAALARTPKTILSEVLIPADAPRALQVSLFVKDKDGLWFQSPSVSRLPFGKWQTIRFDLDPCDGLLSGRGHDGAWNAYYAGHVVAAGLQFFAPEQWKGSIQVGNIRVADDEPIQISPLRIVNFQQLTAAPTAYETAEFAFNLSASVAHPFDPAECDIEATFHTPSGEEIRAKGFYYQPYRRQLNPEGAEVLTPDGPASWRVRFTPLEGGRYNWEIAAKAGKETVKTSRHELDVKPGTPHGFIRVSQQDPHYFETAGGAFFYPIGQNIHSPFDTRSAQMLKVPLPPNRGTFAYDDYFRKMADNGENAVIIWMCNWWVSIEWTEKWKAFHGLGDYNLESAWRLDYLLDAAAKHGIYVLLVLDNHGKFSGYVDSEWPTNPYNAVNGGPCRTPDEFFTGVEAFNWYRKRLDYVVARWGSHPNLLGYEIISEMNLVGNSTAFRKNPAHAEWVTKVGKYLGGIDLYRHPITVQYSTDYQSVDEKVASLSELSFLVGDAYKPGGYLVPLMVKTAQENTRFGKPTFSAEFGGDWNGTTPARLQADLHAGLWANCMTNSAGAPFFWWFDFVDRNNLYSEYRTLTNFMRGDDRRGVVLKVSTPDVACSNVALGFGAVVLSNADRADFWVYDRLAAQIRPEARFIQPRSGVELKVEGLQKGAYRVEYWDTTEGRVLRVEDVRLDDGDLELRLPTFNLDIAGKVRRLE